MGTTLIFSAVALCGLIGVIAAFDFFLPVKIKLHRRARSLTSRWVAATVAVAAAGGLVTGLAALPVTLRQTEKAAVPADRPPSSQTIDIQFLEPSIGDHVAQCPHVSGIGDIPTDTGLWIVVVPNILDDPPAYWIGARAKTDRTHHWSIVEALSIGAPNLDNAKAELFAVLVDREWSDYLAASSAHGNLESSRQLPGRVVAGPLSITRIAEPNDKSCP
jgi:hypothetical protein